MQVATKITKLVEPLSYARAWTKFRRATSPGRRSVLQPNRLIESVDAKTLEAICKRYAVKNPGRTWPKYLELDKWFGKNTNRALELGLDLGPKRRILDLGSGAGYFLYICKALGHDVLGLDIDYVPMYGEMTAALGVNRVIHRINAFEPLPNLGKPFDLITGFMICFNDHSNPGRCWREKEWAFFLDDLQTRLTPGGQIWFELNPENDGSFYTPELLKFFKDRGAIIHGNRLVWGMSVFSYKTLSHKTQSRQIEA